MFPDSRAPRLAEQLKKALAHRYGKAFSAREDYEAECVKKSSSRWSCAVQWDYGQFVYKGKVGLNQALRWARCDPALAAQDEVDLSGAQAHGRRCAERC